MAKLFYKTKHGYVPGPGISSDMPSETVQGEVRSLREILDRYQRTGEISRHNTEYVDVEDIDSIDEYFRSNVDLTDLDTLKERTKNLQKTIEEAESEKADTTKKSNTEDDKNEKSNEGSKVDSKDE